MKHSIFILSVFLVLYSFTTYGIGNKQIDQTTIIKQQQELEKYLGPNYTGKDFNSLKSTSKVQHLLLESSAQNVFQLDSIVRRNYNHQENNPETEKDIYTYNEKGQEIKATTYIWIDSLSSYKANAIAEIEYNSLGNGLTKYVKYWDAVSSAWITYAKQETTFNDHGIETNLSSYMWISQTQSWYGMARYEYVLDSEDNMSEFNLYQWNMEKQDWSISVKDKFIDIIENQSKKRITTRWDATTNIIDTISFHEYSYDTKGNELLHFENTKDTLSGKWISTTKTENSYDNKGNMTSSTFNIWDNDSSQWISTQNTELQYNDQNLVKVRIYYSKPNDEEDLKPVNKWEYSYDSNKNILSYLIYDWIKDSTWFFMSKTECAYNAANEQISEINYDYIDEYNDVIPLYKHEKTYDLDYSFSDLVLPLE